MKLTRFISELCGQNVKCLDTKTDCTYNKRGTVHKRKERSRNYCCYVNATMGFLCVFVDIYVNSTKRLNCVTGT
jgi:hypothetical protein